MRQRTIPLIEMEEITVFAGEGKDFMTVGPERFYRDLTQPTGGPGDEDSPRHLRSGFDKARAVSVSERLQTSNPTSNRRVS